MVVWRSSAQCVQKKSDQNALAGIHGSLSYLKATRGHNIYTIVMFPEHELNLYSRHHSSLSVGHIEC